MKLAILIPTYNERDNIEILLKGIHDCISRLNEIIVHIIFIDDNSPDATAQEINRLTKIYKESYIDIKIINRKHEKGLATAYITGFKYVLNRNYDFVSQMDADLSHNPRYLEKFIQNSSNADMIVGSRYTTGGGVSNWSKIRKAQSKVANIYANVLLNSRVTDYTGGFNMYSTSLLSKVDFDKIYDKGYSFQISLKHQALKYSDNFIEIPIIFKNRLHGKSKIPKRTVFQTIFLVISIAINDRFVNSDII
jgi:dolichol-phosphate mannosyltransferase